MTTDLHEAIDRQLVEQIAHGRRDAYEQLLHRQFPAVSRYVQRMLVQAAETEDIVQEVFLRLWTQANSFDPNLAGVSTWLHRIAHNLCIDHLRQHNRLSGATQTVELDGGVEPDNELENTLRKQTVKQALAALPDRQRSAIILCHFQELSNVEAALILDVSIEALESLLARGRRKLRVLLEDPTCS